MTSRIHTRNRRMDKIVVTAIIAALYVVLTVISSAFGLSYSVIQFRLSEALTILPVFSPYAITGLTLGCFIANLTSPLGLIDIVVGTFSTYISAYLTRRLACIKFKEIPILSPLPPVCIGAIMVGAMLSVVMPQDFSPYAFAVSAISVGIGQFVVCYGLGLPLLFLVRKLKIFENQEHKQENFCNE